MHEITSPTEIRLSGSESGFTLIELSIVLVIIGLIVGGILTGQSLIAAAGVRSQITQIEKYNQAVNAFRGRYAYLPGDIPAVPAAQFGFAARGSYPGQGDGNGYIEGTNGSNTTLDGGVTAGEAAMFWVDLSTANLIDGNFNTASSTVKPSADIPQTGVANYMPPAKIGRGNYVYVWSGGVVTTVGGAMGQNMFGLAAMSGIIAWGPPQSYAGLTVAEAYAIDNKIDDGLPLAGRVQTVFVTYTGAAGQMLYPTGVAGVYAYGGGQTPASATTCYDNANSTSNPMSYSITTNNGAGVNCALSFRFQ